MVSRFDKIFFAILIALAISFTSTAYSGDAQRIISAGGDITEIIFTLKAGDRVIAVDSTSNYPPETKNKKQIGYIRRLSAEGMLSLGPDQFLAAHDAGPPAAIEQMRSAGVRVVLVPKGDSVRGVVDKIRFVGASLGLDGMAEQLARKVEADLEAAIAAAKIHSEKPRVMFVLSLRDGSPLVSGTNTSADVIIRLSGGINAANAFSGYKPMSREAVIGAAPDVLLMMSQMIERLGGIDTILKRPEFAVTPAGRNRRYVKMEGMLLLGFGPRTPLAIRRLASALHDN